LVHYNLSLRLITISINNDYEITSGIRSGPFYLPPKSSELLNEKLKN